jgi:tetratricopeptide (TPR) repeat protein
VGRGLRRPVRAVDREPNDRALRLKHVLALSGSGDRAGVGRACADLLAKFGDAAEPLEALGVAGFCRLAPEAAGDRQKLAALRALAENPARAELLIQHGQAGLVAVALGKAVGRGPDYHPLRRQLILSRLEAGDLDGARRAASEQLAQFGKTSNPGDANSAAWFSALAPVASGDQESVVRLAEVAVAKFPPASKGVALNTLGAALYRAGRFNESIRRLDDSVKAGGGGGLPEDWAFLAMAHHRRGEHAEALRWLDKLRSVKPSDAWTWNDVEVDVLRRETEAVVAGDPAAHP